MNDRQYGTPKMAYTIAIKHLNGVWQHRCYGDTARQAKRNLAKRLEVAQSRTENLPYGKSLVTLDTGLLKGKCIVSLARQ